MQTTNAARNKDSASVEERAKEALVDEVIEAFGAMRGRGLRGIRNVHRGSLSVGHLQVLVRLQFGGPLPVSRVAEWLGVSAAAATGMVGRMEERGLIERVRDDHDRRVVLVRLAPPGRAVLDEIGTRGRASLRRVLVRLEGYELEQLRNGLVAFRRAAQELAEDEAGAEQVEGATREPACEPAREGAGAAGRRPGGTTGSEAPDVAEDPE